MDIKLSAHELILLLSRISNDARAFEFGDRIARKLLLKLFSAFNEIVLPDGFLDYQVPVGVTQDELWLLRSVVSPLDNMESKPIGIALLLKVHELLIAFNTELDIFTEGEEDTYEVRRDENQQRIEDVELKRNLRNARRRELYKQRKGR